MSLKNCRKAKRKLALASKYESLGKSNSANSKWKKRKFKARVTKYRRQAATLCPKKPAC
jgi:hypothetical protein